jgi:hypothetical protein
MSGKNVPVFIVGGVLLAAAVFVVLGYRRKVSGSSGVKGKVFFASNSPERIVGGGIGDYVVPGYGDPVPMPGIEV